MQFVDVDIVNNLERTIDLFYQQKEKEGYTSFNKDIVNITNLINSNGIFQKESNILNIFNRVMMALQEKDIVLVADILNHELLHELKKN